MSQARRTSFVVRVAQDGCGHVTGVIEQVATAVKQAFTGMEAIGPVIAQMLQGTRPLPMGGSGIRPPADDDESRPGPRPGGGSAPKGGGDRAWDQRAIDAEQGGPPWQT